MLKTKTPAEAGVPFASHWIYTRRMSTGNKPVIHHHSKINDLRAKWARLLA